MSEIWKPIAIIFIALGVVIAFGYASIYGFGTMQKDTAGFRGGVEKKERVEGSGDYRIAHRDEFYKLCSTIQATNVKIKGTQDQIEASPDKETKDRLRLSLIGLGNQKAELVEEYNAKAANTSTQGKWRDPALPYHIDHDDMEVSCN